MLASSSTMRILGEFMGRFMIETCVEGQGDEIVPLLHGHSSARKVPADRVQESTWGHEPGKFRHKSVHGQTGNSITLAVILQT